MDEREQVAKAVDELRRIIGSGFLDPNVVRVYRESIDSMLALPSEDNEFLLQLLEKEFERAHHPEGNILLSGPIIHALRRRGESRAVHILARILIDPVALDVREDVAETLGELQDPIAVPALITTLDDEEDGIRAKAAYSLGELGDERAIEPLIDLLLKEESETVIEDVIRALVELKARQASTALVKILESEDSDYIRVMAAKALGDLGVKSAAGILQRIADEESDSEVAAEARKALLKL